MAPWPHQLRVVREVTRRYPESFLFCDEVGLGKTVEAALALRQLLISGRVRRALILTPKALLRQWQEELHEKAALAVPRLAGGRLLDVAGREFAGDGDVWTTPLLLASSQLAKRRDRRAALLAAPPWDLVVVDEAHHARRQSAGVADGPAGAADARSTAAPAVVGYRPNRLLELLGGNGGRPGLKDRTRCLYLLTATPMQVHPIEVWDLLKLLGLGGRWGAREEDFLAYFRELRRPVAERDWGLVLALLADFVAAGNPLAPELAAAAERRLGAARWRELTAGALATGELGERRDADTLAVLDAVARRHTPLRALAWRHTRDVLRRYHRQGAADAGVPEREPRNVWIRLTPAERALYDRIDEHVSRRYQRCEAERRGLGFVMTVYRRRLTSSFYAIRRSLERRLDRLRRGVEEAPAADGAPLFAAEREREAADLEAFVAALGALPADSKLEQLRADLRAVAAERDCVLVFTQYTDTLDHLRAALRPEYGEGVGDGVACFSGRGGERWTDGGWTAWSKEELKEWFRGGGADGGAGADGESGGFRILLATEAASEGLNLQTCGALINYDMPWNPMRVEQRIGRLDRIGQRYPRLWIRSYFYEDTVEAVVYQRLGDRIRWFEDVVGTLQPILHRVGETIAEVAMLPRSKRRRGIEERLATLRRELDAREPERLDLELGAPAVEDEPAVASPVTLAELEEVLTSAPTLAGCFTPDAEIAGAWRLRWQGDERRVTFDPALFDRFPYALELLTYGRPLLDELLAHPDEPPALAEPGGLGLYRTRDPAPVSLFLRPTDDDATVVEDLAGVRQALLAGGGRWRGAAEGAASAVFSRRRREVLRAMARTEERRRLDERSALVQAARQLLVRAALVELARARTPTLFDAPPAYGFGAEAVAALARHGAPFVELLRIAGDDLAARAEDPFYAAAAGWSPARRERRWRELTAAGVGVAARHADLEAALAAARLAVREPSATGILERSWLALPSPADEAETAGANAPPCRLVPPAEVRPFVDAVPLYDDLAEVAARFADAAGDTGEPPQADEALRPGDYRWVEPGGRVRPRPGLFVAPVTTAALDRRVPAGSWALFDLAPRGALAGRIVLARHRDLGDGEVGGGEGGGCALRIYDTVDEWADDGAWQGRQVVLKPAAADPRFAPIVLRDLEEGELTLVAELLEVLG